MNSATIWKTADNSWKSKGKKKPAALKAANAAKKAYFAHLAAIGAFKG